MNHIRYLSAQLTADEIFNSMLKKGIFQLAVLFHSISSQNNNIHKIKTYFQTFESILFIFLCAQQSARNITV